MKHDINKKENQKNNHRTMNTSKIDTINDTSMEKMSPGSMAHEMNHIPTHITSTCDLHPLEYSSQEMSPQFMTPYSLCPYWYMMQNYTQNTMTNTMSQQYGAKPYTSPSQEMYRQKSFLPLIPFLLYELGDYDHGYGYDGYDYDGYYDYGYHHGGYYPYHHRPPYYYRGLYDYNED